MDSDGHLSITISNQSFESCSTGELDTERNDFNRGYIDSFFGPLVGGCDGFDLGDGIALMTISHSGSDMWIGDWVRYCLRIFYQAHVQVLCPKTKSEYSTLNPKTP